MADIPTPHTIAIIGAGVAGPVLALTILSNPILKQRYRPVIYERLPCPIPPSTTTTVLEGNGDGSGSDDLHTRATYAAGAAVALTSNALYPLYSLGLRPSLDAISCETRRIKIWRSWGGKGRCEHKYCNQIKNPNWQEDLDTNLRVVERAKLQRLVLDKVHELGGAIFWGKKLSDVQNLAGGEMKLCFEGGEEAVASLVVGADGGWSLVRRHIVSLSEDGKESKDKKVNQLDRWKPEFAHADGIYGVSKPIESSETINAGVRQRDIEEVEDGDTHWVLLDSGTASTWALPGGRQFWTISFPSEKPPRREHVTDEMRKPKPLKLYDADITLGGYTLEETEEVLRKYESAWHPVAGSFGELFRRSERIVRASLWYRAWEEHEIGGKNVVVMGDAARLMLPTSGQGAGFAIEDATVFATKLLNNPPSLENGTLDFSVAIEEYVKARVPRSKSMTKQSYWTAVLGLGDRWWWRWLRDFATMWLPLGNDPKANKAKKKDPMGWLYDVRYKVEMKEAE